MFSKSGTIESSAANIKLLPKHGKEMTKLVTISNKGAYQADFTVPPRNCVWMISQNILLVAGNLWCILLSSDHAAKRPMAQPTSWTPWMTYKSITHCRLFWGVIRSITPVVKCIHCISILQSHNLCRLCFLYGLYVTCLHKRIKYPSIKFNRNLAACNPSSWYLLSRAACLYIHYAFSI